MKFAKKFATNPSAGVKTARPNKTTDSYWMGKVQRTSNTAPFNVRMMHEGESRYVSLGTTSQRAAARRAAMLYLDLKKSGWKDALENLQETRGKKLQGPVAGAPDKTESLQTVGWFITESRTTLGPKAAASTIDAYTNALRCIVRESVGAKKVSCKEAESQAIELLTLQKVSDWRDRRFKSFTDAGLTATELNAKKRTINATIRNAKALFAKDYLETIAARTGTPVLASPFAGLKPFTVPLNKYVSKVDLKHFVPAAKMSLKRDVGEEEGLPAASWVIFLLAFFAGLRANEIDKLQWSQIDFDAKVVSITATDCFTAKTSSSNAEVPIDQFVLDELSWYRGQFPKKAKFLVCPATPIPVGKKGPERRRLNLPLTYLCNWLRNYTCDGSKPLASVQKPTHELRKEAGSVIMREHGIYQASLFLRHADIQTTVRFYADSRSKKTVGLGHLLADPAPVENPPVGEFGKIVSAGDSSAGSPPASAPTI